MVNDEKVEMKLIKKTENNRKLKIIQQIIAFSVEACWAADIKQNKTENNYTVIVIMMLTLY